MTRLEISRETLVAANAATATNNKMSGALTERGLNKPRMSSITGPFWRRPAKCYGRVTNNPSTRTESGTATAQTCDVGTGARLQGEYRDRVACRRNHPIEELIRLVRKPS